MERVRVRALTREKELLRRECGRSKKLPKRKTKKPQRQSTTSERREDNFDKGEEEFVREERRRGANRNAALSIDADDHGEAAIGSRHASGSSEDREERRRGARQEFSCEAAGDETANKSRHEEIRKQQECLEDMSVPRCVCQPSKTNAGKCLTVSNVSTRS